MKKSDFLFAALILCIVLPFIFIPQVMEWYNQANVSIPYILAFIKFALLATIGEMMGLRIKQGEYIPKEFGIVARMVIWGLNGVWIAMAMKCFATGIPIVLNNMGLTEIGSAMKGELSPLRVFGAFCISVMMNYSFAPVFMTLHKVTDAHIIANKGAIKCLITPIDLAKSLKELNWSTQIGFVFKKTVPLFWVPAHTITFLLPATSQVLFAALLSIALGLLLSIAAVLSRADNK